MVYIRMCSINTHSFDFKNSLYYRCLINVCFLSSLKIRNKKINLLSLVRIKVMSS